MSQATMKRTDRFLKLLNMAIKGSNDQERLTALKRVETLVDSVNGGIPELLINNDTQVRLMEHVHAKLAEKDSRIAELEKVQTTAGAVEVKRSRPKFPCPCGCGYSGRSDALRGHIAMKHPEDFLKYYPVKFKAK